jgi:chemotaxis signal transduction protein
MSATTKDARWLCVLFRVDGEQIAIRSVDVQKVTPRPHISLLPRLPRFLVGITQHRGRVVTVVDVARVLFPDNSPGLSPTSRSEERLLILERPAQHIGLLVERVDEIETLSIPRDAPEGPSPLLRLLRHRGGALPLLDVERLCRTLGVAASEPATGARHEDAPRPAPGSSNRLS